MKLTAVALAVALSGGLWPFGDGDQAPDSRATIGDLKPRKLDLREQPAVDDSAALARRQYRAFLEAGDGGAALQLEAMRRLADLSVAAAEEADAEGLGDPVFLEDAIALYEKLLQDPATGTDADRAALLYQLARARELTGDTPGALKALDMLVRTEADSSFYDEAEFRRGEILFVAKQYHDAELAYAAVIGEGEDSTYFEQALYKHGWSLFKQGLHEESLPSFLGLLDRRLGDQPDPAAAIAGMSRPEQELLDDTFRVLGISYSYMEGADTLNRSLDQRPPTSYANLLYAGLGNLYLDKERFSDAAAAYAAFVAREPTHAQAPALQQRVIDAYTLGRFPSLVLEAKRDYVRLYGFDTEFWAGRERSEYPVIVGQIKQHLSDLASYDHALAQADGGIPAYERAAGWYRRYLDYFPDDPDSAQRSFLLAEIYQELQRYGEATEQFLDAAYAYGPHPQAADAAYAAVLAARLQESRLEGAQQTAWQARMVTESLRFAENFPAHPQAAAVRTKVAEELFAAGELERAVDVAALVVTMQPPASMELERTAWRVIAHAQFDLQQFADAEQAYRRLQALPMENPEQVAEIEQRIAASIYRQAEQARDQGDVDGAVAEFLRVADSNPDAEIAPTAMYDAAALLISEQRWTAAVPVLERFQQQYPAHEFGDDVVQKLAVTRREAGQAAEAASEFERVAALGSVDSAVQREALWEAAELYGVAERKPDKRRVLALVVERFPQPLGESIEARQELADLAGDAGDVQARWQWLRSIIRADATAGEQRSARTTTLAARASLELALPLRDAFNAAELTNPLKESLPVKKSRMEQALDAFGNAAEYGVDEVVTAASFEIAELYYRLSQELMASERPPGLDEVELEQYDILLEEQAFPFEEQAIDIYAANAARAADGMFDEWIKRSYGRLAELVPARYAKPERSEALVAQLD